MTFAPTEEQRMIADGFARLWSEPETPDRWSKLHELGLARATWPEALGGAGMRLHDILPALVETGRAAATEPVPGCAILPGLALSRAGTRAPEMPAALVCLADGSHLDQVRGTLTGALRAVPGADVADLLLVTTPDDRLAVVEPSRRDTYLMVDRRGAADVVLDAAHPVALGQKVPGLADWACDAAATVFAADALGAMLSAREMTLDYLKQRKQFGRPLGNFQALQHAMVDLYHDTEHFLSLVHLSALACDGDGPETRVRAVSSAKLFLGGRMRRAAASAIQMHGGIGMTEDYALGARVKRVMVADMLNGSADSHTARLAGLIADEVRAETKARKESAA